jgi:hypothetical protein
MTWATFLNGIKESTERTAEAAGAQLQNRIRRYHSFLVERIRVIFEALQEGREYFASMTLRR